MSKDFKSAYIVAAQNLFDSLPANVGIEENDLILCKLSLFIFIVIKIDLFIMTIELSPSLFD